MARLAGAVVMLLLFLASATAREKRAAHTRFFFSVGGAKSYSTDNQPSSVALGTSDGWTCTASALELWEPNRLAGEPNPPISRTGGITCTDVSGASVTISAMCNVASAEVQNSYAQLKSAQAIKGFPVVMHVRCGTDVP